VVSLGVKKKPILLMLRAVLFLALLLAAFFLPAGSLDWPEAWIVLGGYLLVSLSAFAWMKRHDPGLLRERIQSGSRPNVKKWDNLIMAIYSLLMLAMIAACGMDRVRWRWSRVPLAMEIGAFVFFAFPVIQLFRVIRHNHFLSERVRIQDDRGHRVCSSGPYARIRHPMYLAIIQFVLLLPLALGSFFGLLPSLLVAALFVLRTHLEDRTLLKELNGYREYARQVSYRLVPGLW
jgi:protein-S-isoprenylcysteine O-methyltransferase Ste14